MYKKRKMLKKLSKPRIIPRFNGNTESPLEKFEVNHEKTILQPLPVDKVPAPTTSSFKLQVWKQNQKENQWNDNFEDVFNSLLGNSQQKKTTNKNQKPKETTNDLSLTQPDVDAPHEQFTTQPEEDLFTETRMKEIEEILSAEQSWKDSEIVTPKKQTNKTEEEQVKLNVCRTLDFGLDEKTEGMVEEELTPQSEEETKVVDERMELEDAICEENEQVISVTQDELETESKDEEPIQSTQVEETTECIQVAEVEPVEVTEEVETVMDKEITVEELKENTEQVMDLENPEAPVEVVEEKIQHSETHKEEIVAQFQHEEEVQSSTPKINDTMEVEESEFLHGEQDVTQQQAENVGHLVNQHEGTQVLDNSLPFHFDNEVHIQFDFSTNDSQTTEEDANSTQELQNSFKEVIPVTESIMEETVTTVEEVQVSNVDKDSVNQVAPTTETTQELQTSTSPTLQENQESQMNDSCQTAEDIFEKAMEKPVDFTFDSVNFPQPGLVSAFSPTIKENEKTKFITSRHSYVDKRQWKKLNTPKNSLVGHPYKCQSANAAREKRELKFQNVTVPKPFKLSTDLRNARRESVKSSSELEAEELDRIRSKPFKAKELDPKIYPNVSNVESKLFNFDFRKFQKDLEKQQEEKETFNFSLTRPVSPPLSFKQRPKFLTQKSPTEELNKKEFKAKPVPNYSTFHPFERTVEIKALTQVEPFELQTEKRLSSVRSSIGFEEKPKKFKAKPIVVYEGGVANVEPLPITKPESPKLTSLQLHELAKQKMKENLENLEREEKKRREFKANPLPDFESIPLKLNVVANLPLTQISNVELNSDKRAEARKEFDFKLHEKHKILEEERKRQEEERLRQEELEIQRLRKSQEVKANPMPIFDEPPRIEKSDKPLTQPKAPLLLTSYRKRYF